MEMTLDITVDRVSKSRIGEVDFENIQFGRVYSDHQFIVDYDGENWVNPRVVPYGNLSMSPAISALHYGQAIFEGMKAYKDQDGRAQLFRPLDNWKRLNESAERMAMPQLPEEFFMEGLITLLELDSDWIPSQRETGLYLRPVMFATDAFIGVRPSATYSFIIFACPVNAYYKQPLKVKAEHYYIRAAEGGAGFAKCAGNYGAVMLPTREAQKEGFHQVMWLDAKEHRYVEETGTTNVFFRIGDSLITPSVEGHTILKGITRDSVIRIARSKGWKVEERRISIDEVIDSYRKGTLKEVFGAGTAATVAKIQLIRYKDEDIELGGLDDWEWSNEIAEYMEDIKTGLVADTFGWMVKI